MMPSSDTLQKTFLNLAGDASRQNDKPSVASRPSSAHLRANFKPYHHMSDSFHWASHFGEMFVALCDEYDEGNKDYNDWFEEEDIEFLKSIGCKPREFFDFIEDCCTAEGEEPTPETALLVTAARRDYFLIEQKGVESTTVVAASSLPAKTAEMEGIVWLPRIIAKAEAKHRGEMDPDTMFCCGGDRAFLGKHNIHPADFLRVVWAARGDHARVLNFVKTGSWA